MIKSPHLLSLSALALLAACGAPELDANGSDNVVIEENAPLVMPAANAANASDDDLGNVAEGATPAINLAPDELTLVLENGAARHATFGMAKEPVLQMVSAALGNPIEQGENEDCGAGPLSFANFRGGLSLYFQGGKFEGWDVDGRDGGNFATANGIGIGSTRKEIEAAGEIQIMPDSTIGIEFISGPMSGLLSARTPEATVTNLWAGVSCIAR